MKKAIVAAIAFAPVFAFAQTLQNVQTLLNSFGTLVQDALPIVVGIALLAFFWGLAKFIFSAGDPDAKDKAKSLMVWSVIALFIMVSIWGIIQFIGNNIGVQPGTGAQGITTPTVNGRR